MSSGVRLVSVQPEWAAGLPLQQQSVLFLAARGPDGIGKVHPCKGIVRAYRACVLAAARYGRPMEWGEKGDSFMGLDDFANDEMWAQATRLFFGASDGLPHHYLCHLYHGAQILGYKHPDERFRARWGGFYLQACDDLHVGQEPEDVMDGRLGDWGRREWDA